MSPIRAIVVACFAASSVRAVTINMVPIGNPGNLPDTEVVTCCSTAIGTSGYGSVGYGYQMGKYEVTAGQYTEFLNAVAKADPNGLYNTAMADTSDFSRGANIQRTGSSPNFGYSVAADWANRPVNYVSFWDAVRFVNWLHNGQPVGPQGPATTEAGAYHNVGNLALFGRNVGARYFLPTDNEWYKAAYHNKTAGVAASYFDYPTGTNTEPGSDSSETTNPGNNANYAYAGGSPYHRTLAGEFELSESPYGTFDQGGNVWEFTETIMNGSPGLRGGSFEYGSVTLCASYRSFTGVEGQSRDLGFRVASNIPEPSTLVLSVAALVALSVRHRSRLGR